MAEVVPRILATISFLPSEEGGRGSPLPSGRIGYILEVGGQNFGCWLLNATGEAVEPGATAQMEIVFTDPDLAVPLLTEGSSFVLKDYRKVASGIVNSVLKES